jgi:hypothetical protein
MHINSFSFTSRYKALANDKYFLLIEMSRCALNRWGAGTTCQRPINTESAKELQLKMAAIKAERERQDSIWIQTVSTETESNTKKLNTKDTCISKK